MLGRVEQAISGHRNKGLTWSAKTFTDRGRGAQESFVGADFMGVLQIDVAGFQVKKGFLAQAKIMRKRSAFSAPEHRRLQDQCQRMLQRSPASFVFLYMEREIRVLPAVSVVGVTRENLPNLYNRTIARFYEEHFESFIGDPILSTPSIEILRREHRDDEFVRGLAISAAEDGERPLVREPTG